MEESRRLQQGLSSPFRYEHRSPKTQSASERPIKTMSVKREMIISKYLSTVRSSWSKTQTAMRVWVCDVRSAKRQCCYSWIVSSCDIMWVISLSEIVTSAVYTRGHVLLQHPSEDQCKVFVVQLVNSIAKLERVRTLHALERFSVPIALVGLFIITGTDTAWSGQNEMVVWKLNV